MLRNFLFCFLLVTSFTLNVHASNSAFLKNVPDVQFNVEYIQDASVAKLSWTCPSQSNIKLFVCEKSVDGKTFEEIARVNVNDSDYIEFDEYAADEVQYYRVITHLQSGEQIISPIQTAAKLSPTVEVTALFYPNPVIEQANIQIENHNGLPIDIYLYSSKGDEVYTAENNYGEQHSIDCRALLAGTYFIKAKVGGDVFIEKIDVID